MKTNNGGYLSAICLVLFTTGTCSAVPSNTSPAVADHQESMTLLAYQDFYEQSMKKLSETFCDGVNRRANDYIDALSPQATTCPNKDVFSHRQKVAELGLSVASKCVSAMFDVINRQIDSESLNGHQNGAAGHLIKNTLGVDVDPETSLFQQLIAVLKASGAKVEITDGSEVALSLPENENCEALSNEEFSRDSASSSFFIDEETIMEARAKQIAEVREHNAKLIEELKKILRGVIKQKKTRGTI
jgi:hypothetical protein